MILKIKPKIIITFADNNKMFYTISKEFPNLKTVMIQNGTRAISGDVFANLESNPNYFVDFMCVHNEKIGKVWSKFIGGKTLVIGSLLNNSVPLSSHISPNVIGLISMYRAETQLPIKININGFKVSWKDRNLAEASLVSSLDKWCYKNNKILKVIGRAESQDEIKNELRFYSELILNAKFEYALKTDNLSSYTAADKAQIVVSMGSTLGYEMLGRGKKVAIFNFLSKVYKDSSFRFGWPSSFSRTGPFWTDDINPKQAWQILDYVDGISMAEWSELICGIRNEIMIYDSDNKLLKSLFNDLLNFN